ncbi:MULTISPECIES: ABC transporter ATP-binding protein [unclassified Paenibacillus]|uniref:ABC transporter ATP-binding protein n=1 Tax=unclassified Paenibacillus TaxID=185978 RepID=UPI0004F609A6|nr:ABC transporter ATP-binding protein [Paenibacillus sp. FSL H7-0737]AIQ26135.1 antibiotic ABC transporter ATP-binding protein [Paenibacillus sp. FSL H7-0737]
MILELNGIVKRYQNKTAVNQVSLTVKEGEIFGLLGPNGAGKTTLISTICGLSDPEEGEILLFGKTMKSAGTEIKKQIGVVPQDIAVIQGLTAYENVTFFGKLYGLKGKLLKERVEEALNFTGLWDRRKDKPGKYSGGMQRRLNIACAIVHQPKLIIMDEPTVGVDPQSRNHILESICELNRRGSTIIYTSHYMEEIEEICSSIAIMDEGRLIACGTSEELKEQIANEEKTFIEVAATSQMFADSLKNVEGVTECLVDENRITVVSTKGSNNLTRMIERLTSAHAEIITIGVERPSLESVFLTLTGRTLRD